MARKKKNIHYIYKTTCNVTGKYYIGMHSTINLDDGYMGSGKRLRYSIRKYGKENHIKEILEFCDNREELANREREIVNEQLLNEDLCMNLVVGGEGGRGFTKEEQRKNAKKSNAKQKILRETDPEWVENVRKKRSEGHKKTYDDGRREKFYFYDWDGKKHSEESKNKMSEAKKGKGTGKANSQFGTCWITNGTENKKIKKEDLESYIRDGWERGRKIK